MAELDKLSDADRAAIEQCRREWRDGWVDGQSLIALDERLWVAGKAAGIEEAWARVNAMIQRGCIPGDGWDETAERNGLVLAANAIREAK